MRHSATRSVLSRRDVIVVASVSCIYGIGDPNYYRGLVVDLDVGQELRRDALLRRLVDLQYERNDIDFHRGTFRVRGDIVEVFVAHEEETALRIEFFGDEIESISEIDPLRGKVKGKAKNGAHLPRVALRDAGVAAGARHRRDQGRAARAAAGAVGEHEAGREAAARAAHHVRHRDARADGALQRHRELLAPPVGARGRRAAADADRLLPQGLPPVRRRVAPDGAAGARRCTKAIARARRRSSSTASACRRRSTTGRSSSRSGSSASARSIYVSATPGDYELKKSEGVVVEQVIRPTGLIDPEIEVRPVKDQVDDLLGEIRERVKDGDRVLVTTLTKRMAEDLTEYFTDLGVKRALPALGRRHARAHRDHPRPAQGRVRRARRHQPVARGARPARGVAGGDPRRRQGGLSAQRSLAHPDLRARGA